MRPLPLLALAALAACASAGDKTRRLGREQAPSSVGALREALKDPSLRVEAAFALGQLGLAERPEGAPEPAASVQARAAAAADLSDAAGDADPLLRRAAVEALGKVGGPDEEHVLLAAATDADAGVRGEAALALFRVRFLERVPEYSTAAVRVLARLSRETDPEVRWRALYPFTRFGEPRAREALEAGQRDDDWRARLFAARGLGKLKLPPSAALLSDPDAKVRAEAALTLAAAGAEAPLSLLSDPSAAVRAAAAGAAGPAARARLEELAKADGPLVRGAALSALGRLDPAGRAARLTAAKADPSWWVRLKAYEALEGAEAKAQLADPDPRVASAGVEVLAKSPDAAPELEALLKKEDAPLELAGAAVDAAAEKPDARYEAPLLALLRRPSLTEEVRGSARKALLALAKLAPEREAAILAALKSVPEKLDAPRRFKPLKSDPVIVLETAKGTIELALDAKEAPNHAAAIADAARRGVYDGTSWHRLVTNFVVQGGDPRGSGWGDDGWRLADEIGRIKFERGTVGMPKAGKDTGGCQLFVSLVPTPHLDGRYTAFGRVAAGLDVVDRLEPGDAIVRASVR